MTQEGVERRRKKAKRIPMPRSQFVTAGLDNVMATVKPSPPEDRFRSASVGKSRSLTTEQTKAVQAKSTARKASRQGVASQSVASEQEEMELLLSSSTRTQISTATSTSVKFHIALLIVGIVGALGCLWTMLYTAHSEEVAYNLGLERVANSLENVLQLLAYPVLMFLIVLSAYAAQQLYRAYREANDPDSYRHRRDS